MWYKTLKSNWLPLLLLVSIIAVIVVTTANGRRREEKEREAFNSFLTTETVDTVWRGADKEQIPYTTEKGKLIWYGYELIANTSYYLGPKGTVAHTSNGMNCQNCHLSGGTLPFGNNYGKVFSTYPLFRARSNSVQTVYDRVNDCFERSLNGKALDTGSREMKAIYAYMQWLGEDVPKGVVHGGTGILKLKFLQRAADTQKGRNVFITTCASCHGTNGQGVLNAAGTGYTYPPLWGEYSYNDGAGLYRLSNFAGFVKANMPFGTDYHNPKLTDEEAWDVAAFVNSQPRPHKDQRADWKKLASKPFDFPFGPYADTFTELQHKYGPFAAIKKK